MGQRNASQPPGPEILVAAPLRERDTHLLAAGSRVGPYEIEYVLGGGGCGIVYAAREPEAGRRVAIKILREELAAFPSVVARFVREADAVNRIQHPNIVTIHEFGEVAPGRPYYVMELLAGADLQQLVQLHGRFSPVEALWLMEPVCAAVQAAHDAGFIHRDIKANNVMLAERVDPGGPTRVVKLLDFGIAKLLNPESSGQGLTEPGARLGTVHNMAPEQIRCEPLDARADVYALGVLLYQLLTGQYPFHADEPRQVALLQLQAPAPRPSLSAHVPPALDAVVLRCLEKQRERRYASVTELLGALRAAVGEAPAELATLPMRALGLHFNVSAPPDAELDDAVLEDLGTSLDLVEQALAARGFACPLRTSHAVLGARVIPAASSDESERADATALLAELGAQLSERPNPDPRVLITATLTIGPALCRAHDTGLEIVGGPLLDVDTWTEPTQVLWDGCAR